MKHLEEWNDYIHRNVLSGSNGLLEKLAWHSSCRLVRVATGRVSIA